MALAYSYVSAEQDAMRNVLDKGEYAFQVKSIAEKPTKSGNNHQLEVEISIVANGRENTLRDWVLTDHEEMGWKLRHFAATCGLIQRYDNKTLEARDFLGKNGICKLAVKEYEKDGEKMKGNSVVDYIKPREKFESLPLKTNGNFMDDQIPNFM